MDTNAVTIIENSQFHIGLCEVGDCGSCMFSFCCVPCAMAQARSHVDSSPAIFNCFCVPTVVGRWLVRSAYGIPGDACEDCLLTTFCCCCSANQVYQTAKRQGKAIPTATGTSANINQFETKLVFPQNAYFSDYLYSCFCMPCSVGDILKHALGMPWCLGCCCSSPILARNFLRYQYRVEGNDITEECVMPCIVGALANWIPFAGFCLWGAYAVLVTQLKKESELRPQSSGNYLRDAYLPQLDQQFVNIVNPAVVVATPLTMPPEKDHP